MKKLLFILITLFTSILLQAEELACEIKEIDSINFEKKCPGMVRMYCKYYSFKNGDYETCSNGSEAILMDSFDGKSFRKCLPNEVCYEYLYTNGGASSSFVKEIINSTGTYNQLKRYILLE